MKPMTPTRTTRLPDILDPTRYSVEYGSQIQKTDSTGSSSVRAQNRPRPTRGHPYSSASPSPMRILSYNCRGLGKSSIVLQCKKKALESKPDVLFLMETRLAKDKGERIWQKCGFTCGWEFPREGFSGGLILARRPKQQLHIIFESKNLVHTNLMDNRGNPLSITFVYGHPYHTKRDPVWAKLRELKLLSHPNWLCIGDFNQILFVNDKFSFASYKTTRMDAFQ